MVVHKLVAALGATEMPVFLLCGIRTRSQKKPREHFEQRGPIKRSRSSLDRMKSAWWYKMAQRSETIARPPQFQVACPIYRATLFPLMSAQASVIKPRTICSAGSIERTAATPAPAARHISS